MRLPGIGPATATAILAMIGNGHEFKCGRQFAAWLGLVPGQYSSGGKARLGHITKAGDAYMRSLLVLGARAVLNAARTKVTAPAGGPLLSLSVWRGYWRAIVAIAAKNARMAWASLTLWGALCHACLRPCSALPKTIDFYRRLTARGDEARLDLRGDA